MHWKQKGYYFGVLLIYTFTTITIPPVGWCKSIVYSSQPNSSPHNGGNDDVTTPAHPFSREDRRREQLDSRRRERKEWRPLGEFNHFTNREQRLRHRMASSASDRNFKNRNEPRQAEAERIYSSVKPPNEDCDVGKIKHIINGEFYISGRLETYAGSGYQSDSAFPVWASRDQAWIRGQQLSSSQESWQKLQPVVECGDDTMTLTVRRRRAVQLQLDRVNDSSVPLSQLPPQCGYSVQSTWRDLSLMAQYDACHVTQEDDSYVLPLLWRGTPVKMSCPVSHDQPQAVGPSSLCCSPYGMTFKVQGATEELKVKVRGEWTPLVTLAQQCGYSLERQDAVILVTAPFITCGITVKDGKYTLSLQVGEKTFTLACPVSPPEELPLTHQPLVESPHLTIGPAEPMPETLEPFPWVPPFYLAPPYYPHPTYPNKYPGPGVHDADNPPTTTSSTPDPTYGPEPIPPVEFQPDYQGYYYQWLPIREPYNHFDVHGSRSSTKEMDDASRVHSGPQIRLSEKRSATGVDFLMQVEAPSPEPPSHDFNPYYHYYHHPKIPLPGPPEDHDPGPDIPTDLSSNNSNNPEFPVMPTIVQQSEALTAVNSDPSLQPVPKAASAPYIPPTNPKLYHISPAPYPPQPYPYHYLYYLPHMARGKAEKLVPLNPNTTAKTHLSDHHNTKLNSEMYPLSDSSVLPVHDKYDLKAYTEQQSSDEMIDLQKYTLQPLLSDDDEEKADTDDKKRRSPAVTPAVQPPLQSTHPHEPDPESVPPREQPSPSTSLSNHNPSPYIYYHHPYYGYFQMYNRPESLLIADNHVSLTSPKEALDPLPPASSSAPQHPSTCKHTPSQQSTTPPTESMYDDPNVPVYPHYYYYLYYQPEVPADYQDPGESLTFKKETTKSETQPPSDSDYSRMNWQAHAAETGYPSIPEPLYIPFYIPHFHFITQQHPHDPSEHLGEEEAEDGQDERKEQHFVLDRRMLCCIQ